MQLKIHFISSFLFFGAIAHATTWSEPTSLSGDYPIESPRIATNASGDVIVIQTNLEGDRVIQSSIQYFGDDTWQATSSPSISLFNPIGPLVGLDDYGNAATCFRTYIPGPLNKIYANYLLNGTLTWDEPQEIFSSSAFINYDFAMSPNGDSIILYKANSANRIFFSRRAHDETLWSTPQEIPGQTHDGFDFKIGMDDEGNAISIWNSEGNILFSYYTNSTNTWSDPEVIYDSPSYSSNVSLSVDREGNAYAVWLDNHPPQGLITYATYFDKRILSWTTPKAISDPKFDVRQPHVNCNNNKAVVVWSNEPPFGSNRVFQVSISEKGKNSWGVPKTLAEKKSISMTRGMIDEVGNVTVFYNFDNNTPGSHLELASFSLPYGSQKWTSSTIISDPGYNADEFSGLYNFQGKAYLAYSEQYRPLFSSTLAAPPYSPSGSKKNNNFGLVSEFYSQLSWKASEQSHIEGVNLFRNDELIEELSAEDTKFEEHNLPGEYKTTYKVNAYDAVSTSPEFTIILR